MMPVVFAGILIASVPAAMMPWIGTSYAFVFWARIFQGISMGFIMCSMALTAATWFTVRERGLASGIMGSCYGLGSAIGVGTTPALFMVLKSWQQTVAWLSIVGWAGLALALMVILNPKSHQPCRPKMNGESVVDRGVLKQALSSPITWVILVGTFFMTWCLATFYNLTPTYLAADKPVGIGFGPMMSGKLMLVVMISGIIGPIVGGLLQDKVFRGNSKPVILLGFAIFGVFVCSIQFYAVYSSLWILTTCLMLAGLSVQFLAPSFVVLISRSFPITIVGKMTGLCSGLGSFGAPIGVFIAGLSVAKYGNYNGVMTLISLGGLAGFVVALFIKRPKEQIKPQEILT
jgi:MFS family permease